MPLQPIPREVFDLPHEELGEFILGFWMFAQAEALGKLPDDPEDQLRLLRSKSFKQFALAERQRVLKLDAETERATTIEKVLHKAAVGDFETAGRLLRQYRDDHRLQRTIEAYAQKLAAGVRAAHADRVKGGKESVKKRQDDNDKRDKEIWSDYQSMMLTSAERNIPRMLEKKYARETPPTRVLTARQIKNIIVKKKSGN